VIAERMHRTVTGTRSVSALSKVRGYTMIDAA